VESCEVLRFVLCFGLVVIAHFAGVVCGVTVILVTATGLCGHVGR